MRPQDVVEEVLAAATTAQTVVAVEAVQEVNLRWAVSKPTTNGFIDQRTLTISAIDRSADGIACATRTGRCDDWAALLAGAEHDSRDAPRTKLGEELEPGHATADYEEPPTNDIELHVSADLRTALRDDAAEYFGYAEESRTTTYVGTTAGWRFRLQEDNARFELSGKAEARQKSAWHGAAADLLHQIDVGAAVADVNAGLAAQGHPIELAAAPTTVILTPSAVADLMICLWWEATARDAAEGQSAFSGRGPAGTALGSTISERELDLYGDPDEPGASAAHRLWTPWNSPARSVLDTGASIERVNWLTAGRLTSLAASRATAAELSLPFTIAPESLTLVDQQGHGSTADLVGRTDRALLITSLWYIRDVDPQRLLVTGLTRDGTYLVEDGRIVGSCGNFRFNDSPLELLGRVLDASAQQRCLPREWGDYFTRTTMPALLVADFGLSTPSAAV